MSIQLLNKNLRDLIAAGEVVERPASAAKELIENAIDAGATKIEVQIRGNGLKEIRVTDNGCGIPKEDVPTAFLRHATSKIRTEKDLDAIGTLGFRGEALAAISAVSRIRLVTRTVDCEFGSCIEIEGGNEKDFSECGCAIGTTIQVSDLFFNTPARMKFLKKDVSEGSAVQQVAEQIAMSHPEISFRFLREDKIVFTTPGNGDPYSAIFAVLPKEVSEGLIYFEDEMGCLSVRGFISPPENVRKSRMHQYVFLNGRWIRSGTVMSALEEASRSFITAKGFPVFVIYLSIPMDLVDVNVHPAKTEVRFSDEKRIFRLVYSSAKNALEQYLEDIGRQQESGARTIMFAEPNKPACEFEAVERAPAQQQMEFPTSDCAFQRSNHIPESDSATEECWERLYESTPAASTREPDSLTDQKLSFLEWTPKRYPATGTTPNIQVKESYLAAESKKYGQKEALHMGATLRVIGELFRSYIIAEYGNSIVFIDKHAAHERILFEQLNVGDLRGNRQTLLEPIPVFLEQDALEALLTAQDRLEEIGFSVSEFGADAVAIREIPCYMNREAAEGAVIEIAHQLEKGLLEPSVEAERNLLHSVACKAAIKAGHHTKTEELIVLAERIMRGNLPKSCPHGRPVYLTLDQAELERRFGRS